MRYMTLTALRDPEMGEVGLCLDGLQQMDSPSAAMEGMLIAHDILEHQRGVKRIGSFGDELLALGAAWYTRGRHSDISRDLRGKGFVAGSMHSPEHNIGSDVGRIGRDFVLDFGDGYDEFGLLMPKSKPECDGEEGIHEILRKGAEDMRAELRDEEGFDRGRCATYLKAAYWLMLKGYNMAKRRFERGGRSSYYANGLFWEIAEAVDRYCQHAEEGQRFRLAYGNGEARCTEIYDEDYY